MNKNIREIKFNGKIIKEVQSLRNKNSWFEVEGVVKLFLSLQEAKSAVVNFQK